MPPTQPQTRTEPKTLDVPDDLDHNREQKGATHRTGSVGSEIDDAHEDNANHLAHEEQRDSERRSIER